jgi:hypothetical protein
VGTAFPYLGVDYQAAYSINPVNSFNFRVVSASDAGCAGASVTFITGAANAQGSSLLDAQLMPVLADSGVTAVTDARGNASVKLQAGQVAGPVSVIATVILPNGSPASATGTSTVVGTQPSVANSGITCTPVNIPVYSGNNNPVCAINSNFPGTTTCTVSLADRFKNAISIAVPVNFYTEAGNWQSQTVNTPDYGVVTTTPGRAINILKTDQATLPQDVDPLSDEPSYGALCLNTVQRTYNPRDGLVTVMASFTGEEEFFAQVPGPWQPGDSFVDLPQPFVDNDDSSFWKPGDTCAGTSTDGGCDGPNHQWDGNGNVWVQNRILYTSDPASTSWNPMPGPTVYALPEQGQVTWADVNLNYPTSATVCTVTAPTAGEPSGFICSYPILGNAADPQDSLGMYAKQIEVCDAGYIVLSDGGTLANDVCNYQFIVTQFSGGFTGTYQVSSNQGHDAGPTYCIQSSAKLGMGQVAASQNCGIVYGYGPPAP